MNTEELQDLARNIRKSIINMLAEAGTGHTAGSLDIVEIMVSLYFHALKHDPENPDWPDRDRLVLSAGHINPALYATMSEAGYFPKEELLTLRKINSRLQGHPHNHSLPGIEASSGPLGQGSSVAVGMALADKMDNKPNHTYCIVSDGEHDEGQIWEAIMFAAKNKLNNLTFIVDRNHIQIDGTTEEIMPLEPFAKKYEAFNWHIIEVDGHNFTEIISALDKKSTEKPTVILAKTIAGKGIPAIENNWQWHGKTPTKDEAIEAIKQLEAR